MLRDAALLQLDLVLAGLEEGIGLKDASAYNLQWRGVSPVFVDVASFYKRAEDEGRTLIQSALASAADLHVTDTELRVTLAPLSSAHRSRAIMALCDQLNRAAVCFPGTRLQLRFAITETAAGPVVRERSLAGRE